MTATAAIGAGGRADVESDGSQRARREVGTGPTVFVERGSGSGYGDGHWPSWQAVVPARHLPGVVVSALAPIAETCAAVVLQHPDVAEITRLRRKGIRVLLSVTDGLCLGGVRTERKLALLALPQAPGPRGIDLRWPLMPATARAAEVAARQVLGELQDGLRAADGLIAHGSFLARRYQRFNRNVYLVENACDPDDWPTPVKPDDGILRVGFAGGPSHLADLSLIAPALRWASKQPGVEVVMAGEDHARIEVLDEELPARLRIDEREKMRPVAEAAFRRRKRAWGFEYSVVPWTSSFDEYRGTLARLDVALAPVATAHSALRSDSRPLEYALAQALPVCSDTPAYEGWRGRVPFARTQRDFLEAVQRLVADPDQARADARAARRYALRERTIAREIHRWRQAVSGA